jgi:guanylate kinase
MSVSVTTRAPRAGEASGFDYDFVSNDEFERRLRAGEFAEFAQVFESSYGTPREALERAISSGSDILLDIDIQGAKQIREHFPRDSVSIFVLPPSFTELEGRLRLRNTETGEAIARRLKRAHEEASAYPDYDYLIINADLADSFARLAAIVDAERLRVTRLAKDFVPWKR